MTGGGSDMEVTRELLERYDRPGPRYTSYPTAPEWSAEFDGESYRRALGRAAQRPEHPLSLYVHIPFCRERCAFCGCNVIISRKAGVSDTYLGYVAKELVLTAEALGQRRNLLQLHWGGGTPTYLRLDQLQELYGAITTHFTVDKDAEVAIEADPRVTTADQIHTLRELGFNRISMGVQDLDPVVQEEIGRGQTLEQTESLYTLCREVGFEGINVDLIYGLPGQRLDTWRETLDEIIAMRPDRLAVYSFAHLPEKLRNQKRIDSTRLPAPEEKIELFVEARRRFLDAGYRAIGMDHFALAGDELTRAMDDRRLYRNFMGYTVVPAPDMIGVGTSAIGEIGGAYAQNAKKLPAYYNPLHEGRFATESGCWLSDDDKIRAWVIRQLMCNFYLDFAELEARFGVRFHDYFRDALPHLDAFTQENFVSYDGKRLVVNPLGQIFVRNIAMIFDAYLKNPDAKRLFSRTV